MAHNSKEPQSGKGDRPNRAMPSNRANSSVQDDALSFIRKLRKAHPIRYERPKVTVIDKRG